MEALVKLVKNNFVFTVKNPAKVRQILPEAKIIPNGPKYLVLVPNSPQARARLNAFGLNIMDTLEGYDWPGFKPYEHQRKGVLFLVNHPRAFLLDEPGMGKTATALWAADHLMKQGKVRRALVVSPLSTLERAWGDEIFKNFSHRTYAVLHGTASYRRQLLEKDYDFYLINHDGFPVVRNEMRDDIDLVVLDESAVYRNPSTKRFRSMYNYISTKKPAYLWLMTGTPTPNAPVDAWAQARLAGNMQFPMLKFRDMVMQQVSRFQWIPRANSHETVKSVLRPALRRVREKCLDLPDTIYMTHHAPMTKEQEHHYKSMLDTFISEINSGEVITAVNEAVRLQKLLQIAAGAAYDANGNTIKIDCSSRLDVIDSILFGMGDHKAIIFVPFTGALQVVAKHVQKYSTVAVVNGAVNAKERAIIFKHFQEYDNPRILVAHPECMSHGLTLTAARAIIWYSPTLKAETYTQACARVERTGKKAKTLCIHIEGSPVERRVYDRLRDKQKIQGVLLDSIEAAQREKTT
ncbi:MAG: DEAD/DEAH box helicase [Candidatus Caldarchaeum sp.]